MKEALAEITLDLKLREIRDLSLLKKKFDSNALDAPLSRARIALKFIPCRRGLNNLDGEPVNERFIASHLLTTLLEAIESL